MDYISQQQNITWLLIIFADYYSQAISREYSSQSKETGFVFEQRSHDVLITW